MHSLLDHLQKLHRPRLLIQAARIGAATYQRGPTLKRLLGPAGKLPVNADALTQIIELERILNDQRLANEASYCAADHVDLLIAMMGEARLLRAAFAAGPSIATDMHGSSARSG